MVEIKKLHSDAKEPVRATGGAGAVDLCAVEPGSVFPGERVLVKTGLAVALPLGHLGFITPRSGLALKYGITVLNSPGLIDSDYRGEVGVIIQNHGDAAFSWHAGDRIAQLAVLPCWIGAPKPVDVLSDTCRGTGGFGSTGVA